MNPKARITYRFDRSKEGSAAPQPVRQRMPEAIAPQEKDGKIVRLYPEELQFADDVMPWRSPFQDDPYALEQLIRETDAKQEEGREPRRSEDDGGHQAGRDEEQIDAAIGNSAGSPGPSRLPAAASAADVPLGLDGERGGEEAVEANPSDSIRGGARRGGMSPPHSSAGVPARAGRLAASAETSGDLWPAEEPQDPFEGELDPYGDPAVEMMPDRDPRTAARPYTAYIAPRRRPPGPSWLKVFASVAGAVLTGALFGYLILSLFADQPAAPAAGEPIGTIGGDASGIPAGGAASAGAGSANAPAAAEGTGSPDAGGAPAASGATVAVSIPARNYYLLQFGVFSGEEGLMAALGQLQDAGYSAAADRSDGYRVFAGIADNAVDADLLAEQLAVPELFVKRVELPAAGKLAFGGQAEDAELFFDRTDALVRFMSERSTAMLAASQPEPFGDKTWGQWEALHRQWTEAASAIRSGAPEGGAFDSLSQAVGTAASAFEAYKDNPSRSHMWAAQSALMEAVFAQKEWLGGF